MHCPICRSTEVVATATASTAPSFDCPRCGNFEMTWAIAGSIPEDLRPYLSAATRQSAERGQPLRVTAGNFRELAEAHRRVTVSEKLGKVLAFIAAKTQSPGNQHVIRNRYDYPLADARDVFEFDEYCLYLVRKGFLGRQPGSDRLALGPEETYQVTVDGWREIEPRIPIGGEPGRCFVASWLDD